MHDATSYYSQLITSYKVRRNAPKPAPPTGFEIFMTRNVAQLMGFAKPYVGSLTAPSVGPFLERALKLAEQRFDPKRLRTGSMLMWWDECLREVAVTQDRWKVRTFDGWRWLSGWELGREDV